MALALRPFACSVSELVPGVDALYLSGRAELPEGLATVLEARKAAAVEAEGPVPFDELGEGWVVEPRGFGKYRFCLTHEQAQLGVTLSDRLPALRVQPRAGWLHGVGPAAVVEEVERLGERLVGGPVSWGTSRMDLFCDVQGWALSGDDRHRFVCRATKRDLHEDGDELDGIGFGRRTTKTVSARLYDKTREMAKKGTDWWPNVWGPAYDADRPVLRVEFELGREGLKQYGVDTPRQALDGSGPIWASLTDDWLSYRSPTADSTRSRWPVAAEWEAVQQASIRAGSIGLERLKAGRRKGEIRKLTPALVGYLASLGALLDLPDLGSTLAAARHLIEVDERRRGVTFPDRIAARLRELELL